MIGNRCLRVAHHAFILFLVVATAAVLSAQTVVDPRYVEFTPSADHNTNASDGTPLVQRYSLSVYPVGSSVASDTMDLGKPTPSGGVIRVDFLPLLHSVPTPGVVFEARVTAVGPGGSTASSLSNGFSFQASCTYTIASNPLSIAAGGGPGSTAVTAATGCAWTGVSNASWITVTSGASGSGPGTVAFSVAANTGAARSGTLTIAGQTFTVNQAAPCSYTLSSNPLSIAAGGGPGSTAVTAATGCAWTGVSNASWITVTSGASGSGPGTVAFSVAANTGAARSGTLTIAGQTFTVNQAAPCSYTLSSNPLSIAAGGGPGSTAVTAATGCAWTGVSNASWITVTSGASGSGPGTVAFSVAANTGAARSGTLTIAGQTFTVNQAAPCSYTLSSNPLSIAAGGGPGSTAVTAATGCAWTGVSNASWITVTSGASGSGPGTVAFSVAANTGAARSGTLTIAGQTFTVNQAAPCSYTLSSNPLSIAAGGGPGSTAVTAATGCAWTGVSNASWITVTSGASGSGPGTVAFSVAANTGAARSGTLTIAGQTFTVNQAAPCSYTLSSNPLSIAAGGGPGSTAVTAATGCAWTGVSNASWITVTSGASGSGPGTVAFSVAANTGAARSGTLTIAGQTFTVNQAAPCSYTLSSNPLSIAAGGGPGSTAVTAATGCAWTGVSNASWITVTSGASGSGPGTVAFSVAANTGAARSGTLTIAGQTFTVNQAAPCTYAISPGTLSMPVGGGPGLTDVTAPAGCTWTAISNDTGWLTVTSGASGNGNGMVGFSTTANPNGTTRSGTLTIAGQPFTVTQAAAPCTYGISPGTLSVVAGGGPGSTAVTAATGCAWTGVSNASWITVTSGANGSGNGTVAFSVAANTSTSGRNGTLTIAGQPFTVTQAAAPCTYGISPGTLSMPVGGGPGSTAVTAATGCAWTGVSNASWITVTSGASGSGDGTVAFSAAANTSSSQRTGTLTIAGQAFTVTQDPAGCSYSIAPSSLSVAAAGADESTTVTTTTGCSWTAVSGVTWITVTAGATGSGTGSVSFTVAPSPSTSQRIGTLSIAGQTLMVTQLANTCSYVLAPASTALPATGGTGSITVTTAGGCNWAASTTQPWISVSGTGTTSGTASYTVSPNTGAARIGAISIGTQVFTVSQSAATGGCTYAVSPTSQSIVAGGGTGSTNVTAPAGCAWTAVSNSTSWLTLTSGGTGSGNGAVGFSAAANTSSSQRSGTLTIAGQAFTVTQPGVGCSFSISPSSQTVPAAGANGSTTVTTTTGCSWTAVSSVTWITVTAGATGSGTGSVSFTVAPSMTTSQRVGTLTIAGQALVVTQLANTCSYMLTPASTTLPATGGTGSISVATASGCIWTASTTQSWISVSGTGTTSGTASYTVSPNTGGSRVGAISIGTKVFTVVQNATTTSSISTTAPQAPRAPRIVVGGGGGSE